MYHYARVVVQQIATMSPTGAKTARWEVGFLQKLLVRFGRPLPPDSAHIDWGKRPRPPGRVVAAVADCAGRRFTCGLFFP
jgi:hypothetical protein